MRNGSLAKQGSLGTVVLEVRLVMGSKLVVVGVMDGVAVAVDGGMVVEGVDGVMLVVDEVVIATRRRVASYFIYFWDE